MNTTKETIIINSGSVARRLLREGETIIDVKPHRQVQNASVFVFISTEKITKILEEIKGR